MKIHEYQSKELFKQYSIPVLKSKVAFSANEAQAAAQSLNVSVCVVKAQVHAGGRGKAGGVKVVKNIADVKHVASEMLSKPLVTNQTGPEGVKVPCVLVESGCDIAHEYYMALILDRERSNVLVMASSQGGVDIEEVAAKSPEKIIKVHVEPTVGVLPYHIRTLTHGLNIEPAMTEAFGKMLKGLVDLFLQKDCSMVEINPLVKTKDLQWIALDGKINFDDNALFRQKDILGFKDETQENEKDLQAQKYNLNYIHLDGNIGCMVNGAGLAMATMDMIKMTGGEPANFLDVGGGANAQMVAEAFKIIVSDPKVKGILVNIFGGIMKCDVLATGIVQAVKEVGLNIPLVVRLEGTNVDQGRKILNDSKLNIQATSQMEEAAKMIVKAVGGL